MVVLLSADRTMYHSCSDPVVNAILIQIDSTTVVHSGSVAAKWKSADLYNYDIGESIVFKFFQNGGHMDQGYIFGILDSKQSRLVGMCIIVGSRKQFYISVGPKPGGVDLRGGAHVRFFISNSFFKIGPSCLFFFSKTGPKVA